MTIELKWWLAVPLWLWAISLVLDGVATWVHYLGTSDIGPLIGWNGLFNGITQGAAIGVIGTLVFFAFRDVRISVKGKE